MAFYLNSETGFMSIVGDFNFHCDNQENSQVKKLKTLLSDSCLTQLVVDPTQRKGHTLDWVVVRENCSFCRVRGVYEQPGISDHSLISCRIAVPRPPQ